MDLKGSYVIFGLSPICSLGTNKVRKVWDFYMFSLISPKLSELQKGFNNHFYRFSCGGFKGEIFKAIDLDLDIERDQNHSKMA